MTKKEVKPLLENYSFEMMDVPISEILVDEVKTKEGRRRSHSKLGTITEVKLNQMSMIEEGKNYRVIDGRKNINDLIAGGKETVRAKVYKNLPANIDRYILLVSNFQRSASPIVEAEAIEELIKLGNTITEISEITGISPSRLQARRSLLKKLPKEIAELLRRAEIPESTAKKIVSLPKDVQQKLIKEEKITGDVVEKYHREYLEKQLSFDDMDLPKEVKGAAVIRNYHVECKDIKKDMTRKELFSFMEDTLPGLSGKEAIIIKRV